MAQTDAKPDEFAASGDSPPAAELPADLVDALAEILADALVADVRLDLTTGSGP